MTKMKTHREIGFIGLGIMGKPMVLNLLKSGYNVNFFARKRRIIEEVKKFAVFIDSINKIAQNSKIIFLNLPDSQDVENVICGNKGLWSSLQPNTIIIDMSTISPEMTIKLNNLL